MTDQEIGEVLSWIDRLEAKYNEAVMAIGGLFADNDATSRRRLLSAYQDASLVWADRPAETIARLYNRRESEKP